MQLSRGEGVQLSMGMGCSSLGERGGSYLGGTTLLKGGVALGEEVQLSKGVHL